jgi:AcrR family transcriptional regulator
MTELKDTRQRLLEAAGEIFAEKGFKAATVREISERAGANLAAVNYHFRDKESLYRAVLEQGFQCHLERLPLPSLAADVSAEVRLRELIRAIFREMVEDESTPWYMHLLLRELSQPSPAGLELVRAFIRPIYERLWGILRELVPADSPPEKLHLIGFSIIGQCFYHRLGRHVIHEVVGDDEFRRYQGGLVADHIADFSLAAIQSLAPGLGPARGPKAGR